MKFIRALNNNVIQALDDRGQEVILMGRGIAFDVRTNGIDYSKIEKTFSLKSIELNKHIEQLFNEIPQEYWIFAKNEEEELSKKTGYDLEGHFLVSLVDHIYVCIDRYRNNIEMPSIFGVETRYLYPDEYTMAGKIVADMRATFHCDLKEDEVGYIALHLIDAKIQHEGTSVQETQELIDEVLGIVNSYFLDKMKKTDISYERFLIHLKYFAQRVITNKCSSGSGDFKIIYNALGTEYPLQKECASEIKNMILKKKLILMSEEEECYILIHLIKVTNN